MGNKLSTRKPETLQCLHDIRQEELMCLSQSVTGFLHDLFDNDHVIDQANVGAFMKLLQTIKFVKDQTILKRDEEAKGIYFIVEGEVAILASDDTTEFVVLPPGDYFGELSTLFKLQCSASAVAKTSLKLYLLPVFEADHLLGEDVLPDVSYWCRKRGYLRTHNSITATAAELKENLIATRIKSIPLFENWSEKMVSDLNKGGISLVLVPEGVSILSCLSEVKQLLVVVRGRVAVLDKDYILCEIQSGKTPLTFNEEGMFTLKSADFLVTAVTPCLVLCLNEDQIRNTGGLIWRDTSNRWTDYFQNRPPLLKAVTIPHTQIQVVCHWLSCNDHHLKTSDIVKLILNSKFKTVSAGMEALTMDEFENSRFLVIKGDICFKHHEFTVYNYHVGQIIESNVVSEDASFKAEEDSIIMVLSNTS